MRREHASNVCERLWRAISKRRGSCKSSRHSDKLLSVWWLQAGKASDPLRYAFIVSQAELADDVAAVASASYSNIVELEGIGTVSVGVSRADGQKCSRPVPSPVLTSDRTRPQRRASAALRGLTA